MIVTLSWFRCAVSYGLKYSLHQGNLRETGTYEGRKEVDKIITGENFIRLKMAAVCENKDRAGGLSKGDTKRSVVHSN